MPRPDATDAASTRGECPYARGVVRACCDAMQGHQSEGAFGDRRSLRLPKYNYACGMYFVTICAKHMKCMFGSVGDDGQLTLSERGRLVETCWSTIPDHFPNAALDAWITMPNHLHGIVILRTAIVDAVGSKGDACVAPTNVGSGARGTRRGSIGAIVGSFKSVVTKRIREIADASDEAVWQRNYYEHIIRDEDDLLRVRRYIEDNPMRWAQGHRRSPTFVGARHASP